MHVWHMAPAELSSHVLHGPIHPMACAAAGCACSACACVQLPPTPLDDLIERLGGTSNVAELTGRNHRQVQMRVPCGPPGRKREAVDGFYVHEPELCYGVQGVRPFSLLRRGLRWQVTEGAQPR